MTKKKKSRSKGRKFNFIAPPIGATVAAKKAAPKRAKKKAAKKKARRKKVAKKIGRRKRATYGTKIQIARAKKVGKCPLGSTLMVMAAAKKSSKEGRKKVILLGRCVYL